MKTKRCDSLLIILFIVFVGCTGNKPLRQIQTGMSLLSDEIREELREISSSIVNIKTEIQYDVYKYTYVTKNGQFITDPNSPVKYKLNYGDGQVGMIVDPDQQTISRGGLIINIDRVKLSYTILTSNHLVSPRDTTDIYYLDESGNEIDVLFSRQIVRNVVVSVGGFSSWRAKAEVVATDPRYDLAIINAKTNLVLGIEYPNNTGYEMDLRWGDWVFLFGFPKGIKQLTGGWVSESPYPGTLAIDAVVRFGYSGGPVFAISKSWGQLAFVGLIKSVPLSTMEYVIPKNSLPSGHQLTHDELKSLIVEKRNLVEYGTAYFVAPQAIKEFFLSKRGNIEAAGINLYGKYYKVHQKAKL